MCLMIHPDWSSQILWQTNRGSLFPSHINAANKGSTNMRSSTVRAVEPELTPLRPAEKTQKSFGDAPYVHRKWLTFSRRSKSTILCMRTCKNYTNSKKHFLLRHDYNSIYRLSTAICCYIKHTEFISLVLVYILLYILDLDKKLHPERFSFFILCT